MVHIPRWQSILIIGLTIIGLLYALPNLLSSDTRNSLAEKLPGWLPVKAVNLGLDLRGGSHLLLEVQLDSVISERLTAISDQARRSLRSADIAYRNLEVSNQVVRFTVDNSADFTKALDIAAKFDEADMVARDAGNGVIEVSFTDIALNRLRTDIMNHSIEIVRMRVDERGTTEPSIQRQGDNRIVLQVPGLEDPTRLKRLLGQTAKLSFRLVDDSMDPAQAQISGAPSGSELLEHQSGGKILVRKRVNVPGDLLADAQVGFDQNQPVVSFRFDSRGAKLFGEVTSANTKKRLAIVLDDKVISDPEIREPITGGRGIITGGFTTQSAAELSLLLRSGALPAPLKIIEERTVGPSLGADSIAAGWKAGLLGFALVVGLMFMVYGLLFGGMATFALICNMAFIFAILSALGATLTLPGIAGIILTMGMAVDANVLIFERIREEIRLGRTPISAIDTGYSRALSAIIDSNITTLLAALFLFAFGSGPVRGFGVTLVVGILTSMFSAIYITRLMVLYWLQQRRPKVIPI